METGVERQVSRTGDRSPWTVRATSLICLVLLTLLTFVQATHFHPTTSDADRCPICVVMHSAAPVVAVAAVIVFVRSSSPVPVPVEHVVVRRWHYTLFNRPPPTEA